MSLLRLVFKSEHADRSIFHQIRGGSDLNALKTKKYDPDLFNIIKEVFPCQNKIIHRCDQTVISDDTEIEMNCENRPFSPTQEDCSDENENCSGWAETGECQANPDYMLVQDDFQINSEWMPAEILIFNLIQ